MVYVVVALQMDGRNAQALRTIAAILLVWTESTERGHVAPYGWTKCSKLSQHMHIDMLHVSDIRPGKKVVDDVRKHGEAIRVHQLQVLR